MIFSVFWSFLCKIGFLTGMIGGKNSFLKPLSKEDEEKYIKLLHEGDRSARDVLVKHNMRLVVHIAKKYRGAAETDKV